MQYQVLLYFVLLGTLLRPAFIGGWNCRRYLPGYTPMIIFLFLLLVYSILQTFVRSENRLYFLLMRLQPLLELGLITWQARRWQIFDRRPPLFWLILSTAFAGWLLERLFLPPVPGNISWFSIASSFLITLIAIEILNRTMIGSSGPLFRNPVFLFSSALIFYYTFSGLLTVFMLIGRYYGEPLLEKVYFFEVGLGICTNYIYLRSVLCIPQKTNYSIS